ncbi:thioredoxin family protein [Pandoraea sp. NPDC087047]|uniref:thioredoxin family protein n=1 Tax=Pandoraea sp. NPDC087047 TaxID=3364390 RepID=UPI00381D1F64
MSQVKQITPDAFDVEVRQSAEPVLVVFVATWSGECTQFSPALDDIARKYGNRVKIIKCDVDECQEAATDFDVSCMPTAILLKNGEIDAAFSGSQKSKLIEMLDKFI